MLVRDLRLVYIEWSGISKVNLDCIEILTGKVVY
jgi:hypothetical protein